jgi:hypothetical protein
VFLSVDAPAGAILAAVQVPAFALRHFAVGFGGTFFGASDALRATEPMGLSPGQFTAAHALADAPLLAMFAPVNFRRLLCESGNAQAKRKNHGQHHTNNFLHTVLLKGVNLFLVKRG